MRRTIRVAPGIGDNIWILQKLINAKGEKFTFHLPNTVPLRGKQIFDLLPQVSAEASYQPGLPYQFLLRTNAQNVFKEWRNIPRARVRDHTLTLIANPHLEQGRRIEEFLPDLPTSFRIDWETSKVDSLKADNLLPGWTLGFCPGKQYIGIYASAYSTQRNWGFWDEKGWLELIKKVHTHNKEYTFVIIGADFDLDLGTNLMNALKEAKIPYVNSIGFQLGTVIEIMKRLRYLFAFPSGLGILAPTVNCSVMMFYPPHLELMINTWAAPEDIESKLYYGTLFCTPDEAFQWAKKNKKI